MEIIYLAIVTLGIYLLVGVLIALLFQQRITKCTCMKGGKIRILPRSCMHTTVYPRVGLVIAWLFILVKESEYRFIHWTMSVG